MYLLPARQDRRQRGIFDEDLVPETTVVRMGKIIKEKYPSWARRPGGGAATAVRW